MNVSLIPKELEAYISSLEAENAQMAEDMDKMASVIESLENKLKNAHTIINRLLVKEG
jgi:hypothetical protein